MPHGKSIAFIIQCKFPENEELLESVSVESSPVAYTQASIIHMCSFLSVVVAMHIFFTM